MKKKKIIVTGGCGFIGSHLVEVLSKKLSNDIIVIDNLSTGNIKNLIKKKNVKFIKADIFSDVNLIEKYFLNVKIVFHLAALADIVPSIDKPSEYFNSNVTGTLNMLQLAKKYGAKKFVYAASSSCYGIPKYYPTDEKSSILLKYPYALTKKMGEDLVKHWSDIFGIKSVSFRLFNVYGHRARTTGTYGAVFGVFLAQKANNKPLTIVGNGKQKRDFIYVSDVVEAFLKAENLKSNFEIFNVGAGNPVTINYIAKKISKKVIFIPKRPGEPDTTHADIRKIKKILNWKPKIKIDQGIKIMLSNINYWKNATIWSPVKIKKATKNWFKYLK